jgi:hypothetical protein
MRAVVRVVVVLGLVLPAGACGGGEAAEPEPGASASLSAQIIQLRTDEVLDRVEVAVRNDGRDEVLVERLTLRVPGFRSAGPVAKDSPIAPGLVVALPTPHGEVICPRGGPPRVGRPVVTLRLLAATGGGARKVELRPEDPDGLLLRIAERECTERQVLREVGLRFGDRWWRERTADGVVLHGTLEARLRGTEPRHLTQVGGTVIYALRPDPPPRKDGPLARLTPSQPTASVPVAVSVSRCDGHARAETKKPYEFLVWVAPPGGPEVAVTPVVGASDRLALQAVCPL